MKYKLILTDRVRGVLDGLSNNKSLIKKFKAVCKALGYLETNPKHPGLHTHKYRSMRNDYGEEFFTSYVENHTPGAYRIFWYYGPGKNIITVSSIRPHL